MKYITTPSRVASNATRMGLVPARPAAAKAPIATGGVMKETMPKYSMNRCTAVGWKPAAISGGASTMTRKM